MDKFLKRRLIHQVLFGWVSGVRYYLPAVTLEQAVTSFHKYYGIEQSKNSITASIREYQRMSKEFNDEQKEHGESIEEKK